MFQPIERKPPPPQEWNIPLRKRNILLRKRNILLRNRSRTFYVGKQINEKPPLPALYLVLSACKREAPAPDPRTFYVGIRTFYVGIRTFYVGEKIFTKPQNPSNIKAFRAFRSRSKNPNILSIDNQLIIKPQCPPALTGRAML